MTHLNRTFKLTHCLKSGLEACKILRYKDWVAVRLVYPPKLHRKLDKLPKFHLSHTVRVPRGWRTYDANS